MSVRGLAIISAVTLSAFLLLRPVIGRLGQPDQPDVRGRTTCDLGATRTPRRGTPPLTPDPTLGATPTTVATPVATPTTVAYLGRVEEIVFELTNQARAEAGLPALSPEPGLVTAARGHSADMLKRRFFDHVNPDGEAPGDRVARIHRRLVGSAGENIWARSGSDEPSHEALARLIMESWMASPGHRANIERARFTFLGVGVAEAGDEIAATQNFAEVRAYLKDDVPMTVKGGSRLEFAARPVGGSRAPEQVDLWVPGRGLKVAGPMAMTEVNVDVPAGTYQLRFYQPKSGGYTIWSGPSIKVE